MSSRDPEAEKGKGGSSSSAAPPGRWWKIHLFRGMWTDVRRRAPYYWSDWRDAWDYRVVPATVYMFFANIFPALAFSLDMFTKTDMQYGVNEVLLSSVLGAVVFSVLACQPLVIVGVTGPITVFNYTVYDIMSPTGVDYLGFMCWIGIWSLVLHWLLAATNSCNWLQYVTRFPCDIFGFYVACIYLQKGVQVLSILGSGAGFYLSIMVALLVFIVAYACAKLGESSLFRHPVRVFLKDYGTPLTVVFFTGFTYIGRMRSIHVERLPTSESFMPTLQDRGWLVRFWELPVGDIFIALPFAVLLTILFWFDHNVSSLIAQGTEFPLRKPAGFHWDIFLLGLTTGIAGILGLPFPNGLIPQAPFHTESLCVTKVVRDDDDDDDDDDGEENEESGSAKSSSEADDDNKGKKEKKKKKKNPNNKRDGGGSYRYVPTHVVEQRVSNLAQGLITLVAMSPPLLIVLHLVPHAVLAGLFFIMGYQALEGNGITQKVLFLCRDRALTPSSSSGSADEAALLSIRRRGAVWAFVGLELLGFAATFAITQTVAAVGFPVFIFLLIPVRAALMPRWFRPEELRALDAPTAGPDIMESVVSKGGMSYGEVVERLNGGGGGEKGDEEEGGKATGRSSSGGGGGSGGGMFESGDGDGGDGDSGLRERNTTAGNRSRKRSDEDLAEMGEAKGPG